eukprot:gnl/Spiro4/28304_TR13996_c0_g1_i1.p1 gnl/Spiro4/28304_TR13996_c0_g1~~gnl/Spiro4/28304_TR13996_c0_g1_i1.p1  ORF type:complete len:181 (+),score=21.01 gnl/Spiro4/28304_TR13996_c0_g1_i1:44-544(+)
MSGLNLNPTRTEYPALNYVFVEKKGPFPSTAREAWTEFLGVLPDIASRFPVQSVLSLYQCVSGPDDAANVYRAGAAVEIPSLPEAITPSLPPSVTLELIPGGVYQVFELVGSYSQLPEASGRVFGHAHNTLHLRLRNDWNREVYVNDPKKVPEGELITHICLPVSE